MNGQRRFGARAIELGLRDDPNGAMRVLLERAFGLIGDCVAACGDADPIVAEVQECRTTLSTGAPAAVIEAVCTACLDTCREFLASSNSGETERRQKVADLMGVVRDAMGTMGSDADIFGDGLTATASRFDALLKLDNLTAIKVQLAKEVAEFKRLNVEHQQVFQQAMADYQARIAELEAGIIRNEQEATMDALTGLINRGAFDRTLKGLADMPGARFSLALIDVDRLKKINDMHGHLSADRVLSAIAHALKAAVRDEDLVARYGGDEFAVLMRDSPLRQAESRICNAVAAFSSERLTADDGRAVIFTVSGGVAELSAGDTVRSVLKRAEEAQADAKRQGRNRIVARGQTFVRDLYGVVRR